MSGPGRRRAPGPTHVSSVSVLIKAEATCFDSQVNMKAPPEKRALMLLLLGPAVFPSLSPSLSLFLSPSLAAFLVGGGLRRGGKLIFT